MPCRARGERSRRQGLCRPPSPTRAPGLREGPERKKNLRPQNRPPGPALPRGLEQPGGDGSPLSPGERTLPFPRVARAARSPSGSGRGGLLPRPLRAGRKQPSLFCFHLSPALHKPGAAPAGQRRQLSQASGPEPACSGCGPRSSPAAGGGPEAGGRLHAAVLARGARPAPRSVPPVVIYITGKGLTQRAKPGLAKRPTLGRLFS